MIILGKGICVLLEQTYTTFEWTHSPPAILLGGFALSWAVLIKVNLGKDQKCPVQSYGLLVEIHPLKNKLGVKMVGNMAL